MLDGRPILAHTVIVHQAGAIGAAPVLGFRQSDSLRVLALRHQQAPRYLQDLSSPVGPTESVER